MKRRRDPAAAHRPTGPWRPTRGRRARRRRERRELIRLLSLVLLVPLVLFATGRALSGRDEPDLPELLEPGEFLPHAEFRTTDRVGTLLKATLKAPPLDRDPEAFAFDMRAAAAVAGAAGYETIVVQSPDGTTLVSGPVFEPLVLPPDHEGS